MLKAIAAGAALAVAAQSPFAYAENKSFPVTIAVDAAKTEGEVNPVWRFFGADEPNYATMKDGRTTLATLGSLSPKNVYFRTHNLLTTGDGTPALKWGSTNAYTEDANGNPVYNWTILDNIFDTYLARGIRPYVQIGFMPKALSTQPEPYQHEWRPGVSWDIMKTGWTYPPKDYGKWEELVYQWVRHCIDRYGEAEVGAWYWETWNEPNLGGYWGGTREEFFKLHDASVRSVRRALPSARVGGPDIAGIKDDFLAAFMTHANTAGTPSDFISFHAKGQPQFIGEVSKGGHVQLGISDHLRNADYEFAAIAADPVFRHKPIIIGESDPEGCAACKGPANGYRNGTMYSSYTAATFPRIQALAARRGLKLDGILTWAFEFEDQPYFAGFRQLTSNGIDLPVMNMFKMFSKISGKNVAAVSDHQLPLDSVFKEGVRGDPDVGSVAALDGNRLTILVWHYHDDDVAGPDAKVRVAVSKLPKKFSRAASLTHYRVDRDHSNSYAAWQAMGSPIAPNDAQRAALLKAGRLATLEGAPPLVPVSRGNADVSFDLPRQGVSLIVLTATK